MAIRAGDLVRARESTWRVMGSRSYARVRAVRLVGVDDGNRARDCTLFMPFDDVERVGVVWKPRVVSRRRWMRALAELLIDAQPRDVPGSVAQADVVLQPYQLDPVLTMLRGEASRVLVADDVGLGKTVQAAVLVKELGVRGRAERVLVLVPAGLRDQWRQELRERAGLTARMADAEWLASAVRELPPDVNPWSLPGLYLASLDFIKQDDVLRGAGRVCWDVVVVDEAHGLGGGSERAVAAARLAGRSRFVLLLTATPHNGSAVDFETLRRIGVVERDRPSARSALDGDARGGGDPLVIFRRSRLVAGRGVGRRHEHVLRVALTEDERRMHELLTRYVRRVKSRTDPSDAARLAMVVLQKRACSSAWSLARSVARRWRLIAEQVQPEGEGSHPEQVALPFWSLPGDDEGTGEGDEEPGRVLGAVGLPVRHERVWLSILAEVARRAARAESKIRAVARLLRRTAAGGESAVVFTEYRDTLAHLASRLDRSVATVMLHGGLGVEARRVVLARFGSGEARVLLTTDAAGEGLNLQGRCRVVAQVELPWNPTRVEQRIGRVDRLGQSRTVHAWQLVSVGTYEQRVLERLRDRLERIGAAMGEESVVPVRRDESELSRRVAGRLRVMRAVRSGVGRSARGELRRAIERRPPWVTFVRHGDRGPFRSYAPGLLCLWRVRIYSAGAVLIETRVVLVHVPWPMEIARNECALQLQQPPSPCLPPTDPSSPDLPLPRASPPSDERSPSRTHRLRRLAMMSELLAACREPMRRIVALEAQRACVQVWEAERAWRERWRARDAAIAACMEADGHEEAQPLLFPEFGASAGSVAWQTSVRTRSVGDKTRGGDSASSDERDEEGLTAEEELFLVLGLQPGG